VLNGHHRLEVMATDRPDEWMQPDYDQGDTKAGSGIEKYRKAALDLKMGREKSGK
jgi:hypothetical protein